uniref:Uncharacterized protein n=1 Tax=Globodera rostochiensis TaxID=31243 RepID=A0A914HRT1_GLORO
MPVLATCGHGSYQCRLCPNNGHCCRCCHYAPEGHICAEERERRQEQERRQREEEKAKGRDSGLHCKHINNENGMPRSEKPLLPGA